MEKHDEGSSHHAFLALNYLADLVAGLREYPPRIKTKYLYDKAGSEAFARFVSKATKYAPYHQELRLVRERGREIVESLGTVDCLVSWGCGTAAKEKMLLLSGGWKRFPFVTLLDISPTMLERAVENLRSVSEFLSFNARLVDMENLQEVRFSFERPATILTCFGNTVSNYDAAALVQMLSAFRCLAYAPNNLLVGTSYEPDPMAHQYATAEFERVRWSAVERLAEAFGSSELRESVRTAIVYDEESSKFESRMMFLRRFHGELAGVRYTFEAGEHITIGETYNYEPSLLVELFERSGWRCSAIWPSTEGTVRVMLLSPMT